MCKQGRMRNVLVKIPADLSYTGFARFKYATIDECIAPIVEALQKGAIDMRGSCCGHGICEGYINLQDGRMLLILSPRQGEIYLTKRTTEISIANWLETLGGNDV